MRGWGGGWISDCVVILIISNLENSNINTRRMIVNTSVHIRLASAQRIEDCNDMNNVMKKKIYCKSVVLSIINSALLSMLDMIVNPVFRILYVSSNLYTVMHVSSDHEYDCKPSDISILEANESSIICHYDLCQI